MGSCHRAGSVRHETSLTRTVPCHPSLWSPAHRILLSPYASAPPSPARYHSVTPTGLTRMRPHTLCYALTPQTEWSDKGVNLHGADMLGVDKVLRS